MALLGVRVGPEGWEICCQRTDSVLQFVAEDGRGGSAGALVVLAGGVQGAERVVPVGFQAVGDQPVVGVDGQVAATGQVGAVAGAFDVSAAQCIGFGGAVLSSACTVRATSSAWGVRVSSSRRPTVASTVPPGMVWQRCALSWMQRFMRW